MSDTLLKILAPEMPVEIANSIELAIDKNINDNLPKVLPSGMPGRHIVKRHLHEAMIKTAALTWGLIQEGKVDPVKTLPASQSTTPDAAKLARLKATKDVGSYDTWFAVGHELHKLFDGKPDGFAHWVLWSTSAPAYENDWSNVMFMVTKYRNFGTPLQG